MVRPIQSSLLKMKLKGLILRFLEGGGKTNEIVRSAICDFLKDDSDDSKVRKRCRVCWANSRDVHLTATFFPKTS